jgi:hypothetical protein
MADTPEGTPRTSQIKYHEAGYFSFLTYRWLNPLLTISLERDIEFKDVPKLSPKDDTMRNINLLQENLKEQERLGNSHPLLRAVVWSYWPQLVILQILMCIQHFLNLLSPFLLKEIMIFQENQSGGSHHLTNGQITRGMAAVFGLIILGLFQIFFSSQVFFFQMRLGTRIGSGLRGVVLIRCVQGRQPELTDVSSQQDTSRPAVYNVISFDVGPNVSIIWVVLGLWLFPMQIITVCIALYTQVGYSFVPGLILIIVCQIVCGFCMYADGWWRHSLQEAKDLRLGRCNEGFNNIRALQMLSWNDQYRDQIMTARRTELRISNNRLWMQKVVAGIGYVLATCVGLVTLA